MNQSVADRRFQKVYCWKNKKSNIQNIWGGFGVNVNKVFWFRNLKRVLAVQRVKSTRKMSDEPAWHWWCWQSHHGECLCCWRKKIQNRPLVRHYIPPQSYASSAILHHSTGASSIIEEVTINVRMDYYKDLKRRLANAERPNIFLESSGSMWKSEDAGFKNKAE